MHVHPRALILAALLVAAATPLALAQGDACLAWKLTDQASGLRVIAQTGSVVAFGFMSGEPGSGLGYVVYITPALCGGHEIPVGIGQSSYEPNKLLRDVPELLPLP